jgi:hypothetical protein
MSQEPEELLIQFTESEVSEIISELAERPYKDVADLMYTVAARVQQTIVDNSPEVANIITD